MTVLAPSGITGQVFVEGFSAGAVYTTIDGKQYHLHHTMQDATRFYLAAIYANKRIKKTSKRQLMQCMCIYYAYLLNAKILIEKLPVKFEGELSKEESQVHFEQFFSRTNTGNENPYSSLFTEASPPAVGKEPFDEFLVCNSKVTIKDDALLNPENQRLVDTYTDIQEEFNQFLKENNPIPNAGQNRSPYILGDLINLMTDEDPDASSAIAKYNEQVRLKREAEERAAERREREREQENYYNSGKQDYYWSSDCMQRRNMRKGNYKIFRKCEGCRLAPYCSRYR